MTRILDSIASKKSPAIARLTLAALDDLILARRRMAARQHLTPAEWRALDRMRKRAAALRKEQIVR